MDRKKLIYIGSILILTVIISITYFSYAFFTNKQEFHGKLNIVAGTLDYRISSNDLTNNSITLGANETKQIEISIKSLNDIESKYELYYETNNNDIEIGYSSSSEDNPTGTINSKETKKVTVIIKNKSTSSAKITFGVKGGFLTKTLVLDNGNSLELYDTTVTVTLYSAAVDEVYYYDSNNQKVVLGTTDATGKLENAIVTDDITLYSSVAKEPNNLSNPYSKTFTGVTNNSTIYLMPTSGDNMLYWYGYKGSNFEIMSPDYGWSWTAFTMAYPTLNINNISINTGASQMAGLGSKNTVSNGTLKSISTISSGSYVYLGDITNKNINTAGTFNSTPLSTGYNVHTIQTSGNYAFLICYRAASLTVSALWLE